MSTVNENPEPTSLPPQTMLSSKWMPSLETVPTPFALLLSIGRIRILLDRCPIFLSGKWFMKRVPGQLSHKGGTHLKQRHCLNSVIPAKETVS